MAGIWPLGAIAGPAIGIIRRPSPYDPSLGVDNRDNFTATVADLSALRNTIADPLLLTLQSRNEEGGIHSDESVEKL
jgi:hypothetical protein